MNENNHDKPVGGEGHIRRIEELAEKQITDMLVDAGLVSSKQLEHARNIKASQGGDAIRILVALGYVDVERFLTVLADQPGIHTLDLSNLEIDPGILALIPSELARKHQVMPLELEEDRLLVGVAKPFAEGVAEELESLTGRKPRPVLCSEEDIKATIARYYEDGSAETQGDIQALGAPIRLSLVGRMIHAIEDFPALPETVHRAREAVQDPKSSVRDITEIIVMDPPIAAKVLSVANSAAYGFPRKIEDINLAITLLGLRETYSIVLSAAVLDIVEKCRHIDYKRFWLEAVCCAAATRFVLKAVGKRQQSGTFAAGLLHDIGKVALAEVAPGLYGKIPPNLSDGQLIEMETKIVGLSHTEAGFELAERWGLPEEISQSMRFHHIPEAAEEMQDVVAVVNLADALARATGATLEDNSQVFQNHESALKILGLDMELAEAMVDDFINSRDESLRDAIG